MQTALRRASALAFAYGALLYGLPVALLHVVHNRLDSLRDALLLALYAASIYGLIALAPTVAISGALTVRRWLRGRRPPEERLETDWGLRLGLIVFTVLFWVAALLYGLTYQQTLLWHPAGFVGMALYLVVAAAVIALGAGGVATLVERFLSRATPGVVVGTLIALAVLLVGGHVAAVLTSSPSPGIVVETPAQSPPIVAGGGGQVALVGFDGLDPDVVDRLVAAGEMPTFAALREEGVWGAMDTLPDANSAVLWATIYSGKRPREHGILDFYRILLPGVDVGLFPVHRTFFKEIVGVLEKVGLASRVAVGRADLHALPIWEIADHFGLSIGVADGYLYSYPAHVPETEGSWFLSYGLDTYAGLLRAREAEPADAPLFVQPVDLLSDPFGGGNLPREEDCVWQAEATRELLERRPRPRLLNVYCHQPDTVQHESWTAFEPERYPPWRRVSIAEGEVDPVTAWHRRLDAILGELRSRLGPDTAVLVLSDHGHSPTFVHKLETQHRHGPPGAFVAFGGPFRRGVDIEEDSQTRPHVLDVAPTVLRLLGLPVADDLPGRVLEGLLEPTATPPARTLPTYEGLWEPKIRDIGRDRRLNELEIEKLRKLGYVL